MRFVIYSPVEKLFWNADDGWSGLAGATRWPIEDVPLLRLPLGGYWVDELIAVLLPEED